MSAIPTVKGIQARAVTIQGMLSTVVDEINEAVPAPVSWAAMMTPAASWKRMKADWTRRMVPTVN